jgi:hypothetical protein
VGCLPRGSSTHPVVYEFCNATRIVYVPFLTFLKERRIRSAHVEPRRKVLVRLMRRSKTCLHPLGRRVLAKRLTFYRKPKIFNEQTSKQTSHISAIRSSPPNRTARRPGVITEDTARSGSASFRGPEEQGFALETRLHNTTPPYIPQVALHPYRRVKYFLRGHTEITIFLLKVGCEFSLFNCDQ